MPSAESDPAVTPAGTVPEAIARWVKTPCGRAKYLELAQRSGPLARLRRWCFLVIAALRDWLLPSPDRHRRDRH